MPPKKQQQQAPNKKTIEKKKDKVIEDKTFGLKNKKGKKQQQFVKQVANQVKYGGGTSVQKREELERKEKQKKEDEKRERVELDSLLRPTQQKVSAGADPKSVLCLFYKQGQCKKGDKCKFSHDLHLEGKSEKRSMYVDKRDLEEDTIDKWDETKLKEVVQQKHGGKVKPRTDIVCKHFLQAIEKAVYGWFWVCPNGERCIYRHALPPGFVFKKMGAQTNEEEEDTITIEELVENERQQLAASGKALTKVTLDSFKAWKERKLKEKDEKTKASAAKKKEAFVAGRTHGISGREMFEFNPELVGGDDQDAGDDVLYSPGEQEGEGEGMEEGEGERGEEGRDVTDTAGYSDEVLAPPPPLPPSSSATTQDADTEGESAVGGACDDAVHMTGSDTELIEAEQEEEVPIDEDLFATEDLDIMENVDLSEVDLEPDANA